MFNKNFKGRASGFTLIELLLVVGFIAILGIGAYIVYGKVSDKNKANQETNRLNVIVAGVKNLYASSTSFQTLTNTVVINSNILPGDTQTADPAIMNTFGGQYFITPIGVNAGTNNGFRIQITAVPQATCVSMVTSLHANFAQIGVGAGNLTNVKAFGALPAAFNPATLTTLCAAGGSNNEVNFVSL